MKTSTKTRPAKKIGILAVLTALMFIAAGARAGLSDKELTEADFTKRLEEISLALKAPAAEPRGRSLNMRELIALLEDSDAGVRKAAVRGSRDLIQNSRVYESIIAIMENPGETTDIRIEAARALSYAAQYNKVQDALAGTIKYGSAPQALRVMAYKALWSAANGQPRVQDFLIAAVNYSEKDPAARRAAIWALFDGTRNNKPRECLAQLLRSGKEAEAVRIETIKSLYSGIYHRAAQDLVIDRIGDAAETKPVRLAALLSLSGAAGDSRVRNFLEAMLREETDPELRAAAVEASSPAPGKIREYFHLGYKVENGGFVNPIEKE